MRPRIAAAFQTFPLALTCLFAGTPAKSKPDSDVGRIPK